MLKNNSTVKCPADSRAPSLAHLLAEDGIRKKAGLPDSQKSLSIGPAPMLDRSHVEDMSVVIKANAVVTHAKSKLRRIDILEAFYVAFSGGSKIGKGVKDS